MKFRTHIAVRSCVACGARDPQAAMVRIARDASGCLQIDSRRSVPGRGAYLHRSSECLARFAKRRGMIRSLRVSVEAPDRAVVVAELLGSCEPK